MNVVARPTRNSTLVRHISAEDEDDHQACGLDLVAQNNLWNMLVERPPLHDTNICVAIPRPLGITYGRAGDDFPEDVQVLICSYLCCRDKAAVGCTAKMTQRLYVRHLK